MKNRKISLIIPVYNVADYLEETIRSVTNQSIGFEDNIELILVNDGSTDSSEEICLRYAEKYPDNVRYFAQENKGVSAARNLGLDNACGEYVCFVDGDDLLEKDVLLKGAAMLDGHEEIDITAFKLRMFEALDVDHILYKHFTKDCIVDIREHPNYILAHIPSIMRRSALERLRFDERLRISEDTKFIFTLVLRKCRYGFIASSRYLYRKRANESSVVQSLADAPDWYTDVIENVHKYLIDLSMEKFGEVIGAVQYFIMYDIQWRLKAGIMNSLPDSVKKEYSNNIKLLLSHVDDEVIFAQKRSGVSGMLLALKLKYGDKIEDLISLEGRDLRVGDTLIKDPKLANNIEILRVQDGKLHLTGHVNFLDPFALYYRINGGDYVRIDTYERYDNNRHWDRHVTRSGYAIDIDVRSNMSIVFYLEYRGKKRVLSNNTFKSSCLSNVKQAYYYSEGVLVKHADKRTSLTVMKASALKAAAHEFRYMKRLWSVVKRKDLVYIRLLYFISKLFHRKPEWIFCDREFMGGDSGEILYRYAVRQPEAKKNRFVFVVDERYPDYQKLAALGRVCSYHTLKYRLLFLRSQFIISSHADDYITDEFGDDRKFMAGLYRFRYVYLTHGILLHNSSHWLNRVNKDFSLNVTTSPLEYDSIINGPYYFEEGQLIKTGMPRYDNYFRDDIPEEKSILFMPSWRSTLPGAVIPGTQRREYNPRFMESEYYQFYKTLFSDERLLGHLRKTGYRLDFCVHPSFREQLRDFKLLENDVVSFRIDVNSQEASLASKALVTDYSSAACDFAFLGKPVIYANFDMDHIDEIHYYNRGYFDYGRDGFGPDCRTEAEVVDSIIGYIDSGFKVEPKYAERMDRFFFYRDNKNSERVFAEILKLQKRL